MRRAPCNARLDSNSFAIGPRRVRGRGGDADAVEAQHEHQHHEREQREDRRLAGVVEQRGEHAGRHEDEIRQDVGGLEHAAHVAAIEQEEQRHHARVHRPARRSPSQRAARGRSSRHSSADTARPRRCTPHRPPAASGRSSRHCAEHAAPRTSVDPWLYARLNSGQRNDAVAQIAAATAGLNTSSKPICGTRSIEMRPMRVRNPNWNTNRQATTASAATHAGGKAGVALSSTTSHAPAPAASNAEYAASAR